MCTGFICFTQIDFEERPTMLDGAVSCTINYTTPWLIKEKDKQTNNSTQDTA